MVAIPAMLPRNNPPKRAGEYSYEEFHPYGTTAWIAEGIATVSLKRYKFTGMERDEETGLQCHGVRYYAPWLGRWTSADPIGLGDGVNRYGYCGEHPVGCSDLSGLERRGRFDGAGDPLYGVGGRGGRSLEEIGRERVEKAKSTEITPAQTHGIVDFPEVVKPGPGDALRQGERMLRTGGIDTAFYYRGVGAGEDAPATAEPELDARMVALRVLAGTDPRTANIVLSSEAKGPTAIHESVHACYIATGGVPEELRSTAMAALETLDRVTVVPQGEGSKPVVVSGKELVSSLNSSDQAEFASELSAYLVERAALVAFAKSQGGAAEELAVLMESAPLRVSAQVTFRGEVVTVHAYISVTPALVASVEGSLGTDLTAQVSRGH